MRLQRSLQRSTLFTVWSCALCENFPPKCNPCRTSQSVEPMTSSDREPDGDNAWAEYYANSVTTPSSSLVLGLEHFLGEMRGSLAVDCGCGAGRDAVHLLEAGFAVYAFDKIAEAIDRTQLATPLHLTDQLTTELRSFDDVRIPECDLVNASASLFFASPETFAPLWTQVCERLVEGGIFCGDFLGSNDDWITAGENLTGLSEAELMNGFSRFDVLHLHERDEVGPQSAGDDKRWHLFTVVARKQS